VDRANSFTRLISTRWCLLIIWSGSSKLQIRGLLKNVGLVIGRAKFNVFTMRAEELIADRPELIPVVGPLLKARLARDGDNCGFSEPISLGESHKQYRMLHDIESSNCVRPTIAISRDARPTEIPRQCLPNSTSTRS
jgi:hypothetical protein